MNEGANGNALLEVTLDVTEEEMARFEWVEDGKSYREFLVPADRINTEGIIRCLCAFCEDGEEREATRLVRVGFFRGLLCDECAQEARKREAAS